MRHNICINECMEDYAKHTKDYIRHAEFKLSADILRELCNCIENGKKVSKTKEKR